jgi:hypothetical protein
VNVPGVVASNVNERPSTVRSNTVADGMVRDSAIVVSSSADKVPGLLNTTMGRPMNSSLMTVVLRSCEKG